MVTSESTAQRCLHSLRSQPCHCCAAASLPATGLGATSWKASLQLNTEFSQTLSCTKLSKTADDSACSASCSPTSAGCSPALPNALRGAFCSSQSWLFPVSMLKHAQELVFLFLPLSHFSFKNQHFCPKGLFSA